MAKQIHVPSFQPDAWKTAKIMPTNPHIPIVAVSADDPLAPFVGGAKILFLNEIPYYVHGPCLTPGHEHECSVRKVGGKTSERWLTESLRQAIRAQAN